MTSKRFLIAGLCMLMFLGFAGGFGHTAHAQLVEVFDEPVFFSLSANPTSAPTSVTLSLDGTLSTGTNDIECISDPNNPNIRFTRWYDDVALDAVPSGVAEITSGPFSGQAIPISITQGARGFDCSDPGTPSSFSGSRAFTTVGLAPGDYTNTVRVTDERGRSFSRSVTFTVPSQAPTVTLSGNPLTLVAGGSTQLTWSTGNNPEICTASTNTGNGQWSENKSVSGGTQGITGISQDTTFTLTCSNSAGSASASVTVDVQTSFPNLTCSANPEIADEDQNISFSTTGGDPNETRTWSAPGGSPSSGSGSSFSTAFADEGEKEVTVSRGGVNATCNVTVLPGQSGVQPPTVDLAVRVSPGGSYSDSLTVSSGTDVELRWTTNNLPDSCTASASPQSGSGWGFGKDVDGGTEIKPNRTQSRTYTIVCTNDAGSDSDSVTVTVPIVTPDDDDDDDEGIVSITSNQPTTWSLTGPEAQTQSSASTGRTYTSQDIGTYTLIPATLPGFAAPVVTPVSSQSLSEGATITFTIVYDEEVVGGALGVDLKVNGFDVPVLITPGQPVTVSWTTSGGPSACTAVGDPAWSGSKSPGGGSEQIAFSQAAVLVLTCQKVGSPDVEDSATLTTFVPPQAPIVELTVRPAGGGSWTEGPLEIDSGDNIQLRWQVINQASVCGASGAWSGQKNRRGGTEVIQNVTSSGTYTIVCTNFPYGDSNPDSVTVNVAVAPQCSNDRDDDGDTLVDENDPGCHTDFDAGNPASYDPDDPVEFYDPAPPPPPAPQCDDDVDNDRDGNKDFPEDASCDSAEDDTEDTVDPRGPLEGEGRFEEF